MLTIDEYAMPASVAEAYARLTAERNAVIVGGGFFLRLASRRIGAALDLSRAGLDFIRETDDSVEIGAMTRFSELEKSAVLQTNLAGLIPATVAHLPGTQMRNMVSVGGTVYGKYGFSELLTSLLALDCRVILHHGGGISLTDFLAAKGKTVDVVEKVVIKKQQLHASYQMFRNSAGSLPILSVAVTRGGKDYRIAVGGRPGVAALAAGAMEFLQDSEATEEKAAKAAEMASAALDFGNDRRATAAYRRELCRVLVKRALMGVQG